MHDEMAKNASDLQPARLMIDAGYFRLFTSAPRGVQHSRHGFVEFGAFSRVSRGVIVLYPWNSLPTIPATPTKKATPARDSLRLARYYQSLLYSGEFKTRAELARFLGMSHFFRLRSMFACLPCR